MISYAPAKKANVKSAAKEDNIQSSAPSNLVSGSLSEYLYNSESLESVQNMLNARPEMQTLSLWGLTLNEYRTEVRIAIDFIKHD